MMLAFRTPVVGFVFGKEALSIGADGLISGYLPRYCSRSTWPGAALAEMCSPSTHK